MTKTLVLKGVFAIMRIAPQMVLRRISDPSRESPLSGRFSNLNALAGPLRRVRNHFWDRFRDLFPVGTA